MVSTACWRNISGVHKFFEVSRSDDDGFGIVSSSSFRKGGEHDFLVLPSIPATLSREEVRNPGFLARLRSNFPEMVKRLCWQKPKQISLLLQEIFQFGEALLQTCATMNGHVWEVTIAFGDRVGRSALCVPKVCLRECVEGEFVQHYYARRFRGRLVVLAVAEEVSSWTKLSLDFAIIGMECCGSTSLHGNLGQHPEIGFTTNFEDGFLTPGGSPEPFEYLGRNKVLPVMTQIHHFKTRWVGWSEGVPRPQILGMNNPKIHRDALGREALLMIPGLRVIFVACDPVSRLEKMFFFRYCCRGRCRCKRNITDINDAHGLLREISVQPQLPELRRSLGDRLKIIHQHELRDFPSAGYDMLARFLGATPFPSSVTFTRLNSHKGPRTGLCKNATLLQALKRQLEPEYQVLERALNMSGAHVPDEFRLRLTRCDNPLELRSTLSSRCPKYRSQSTRCRV